MTTKELINDFLNISIDVKKLAENFLNLSYNQINWKPADSQWSIGECIEHLIRTNAKYIQVYERYKLPDERNDNISYKQFILGKLILKTVNKSLKGYFGRLKYKYRTHKGLSKHKGRNYFRWYFYLKPI